MAQAQQPGCDTGYPNCEACKGSNGNCVPWGPIEVKSFPMVAIPNMQLPCSPQPGCVMKVAIKKRNCNGRIQMKVCGMKMEGCTANSCKCEEFFKTNPTAFLWYAYGPPFMNNAFGLFQNVPFDFVDVDIFSYTCYGIYRDIGGCAALYIIPCKEYACCKYSLRVKGTTNCGTTGFVSEWLDASKKYYNYSDGTGTCDVCQWESNQKPNKPCPDGNVLAEYRQIEFSLGWTNPDTTLSLFARNKALNTNTCVYSCHDLDTFFKTWYMSNGQIYKSKNSRRKKRFPEN